MSPEVLGTTIDPATGQVVVLTSGGGMLASEYTPPDMTQTTYNPSAGASAPSDVIPVGTVDPTINFGNPVPEVGTQLDDGRVWNGNTWVGPGTGVSDAGVTRIAQKQDIGSGKIEQTVSVSNLNTDVVKTAQYTVSKTSLTDSQKQDINTMIEQGSSALEISNYMDTVGISTSSNDYKTVLKAVAKFGNEDISEKEKEGAYHIYNEETGEFETYDKKTGKQVFVKLPDNQWILKSDLNDLKKNNPEYYQIAVTEGFDALQKQITADRTAYENYEAALSRLDKYKVTQKVSTAEFMTGNVGTVNYDIVGYLHDHPDDTKTLAAAGWDEETIQQAILFNANNTKLPDGKWIANDALAKLKRDSPDYLYKVATKQGYDALQNQIKQDYTLQNKALASLNSVKTGETQRNPVTGETRGSPQYDIAKYLRTGGNEQTLQEAGFTAESIQEAKDYNRDYYGIGLAANGKNTPKFTFGQYINGYYENKGWDTDGMARAFEYKSGGLNAMNAAEEAKWAKTAEGKAALAHYQEAYDDYTAKYGKKATVGSLTAPAAGLAFAPGYKILEPSQGVKQVTGLEWAVGGAQVALYALPAIGAIGGKAGAIATKVVSGSATGIFAYDQSQNWSKYSPGEKAASIGLDLLVLTPFIGSALSKVNISKVKIPTKTGEVVIWKGVDINGKPIIGISESKVVVGKSNIKVPEGLDVEGAYRPITKVETTIIADPAQMRKLGIPESEIAKVQQTLSDTRSFAGKKSAYTDKYLTPEEVKALNKDSVSVVFKEAATNKDVEMVYGSSTIRTQLEPSLRGWREPADIDIQLKLNSEDAAKFAQKLADELKITEGANNVRISKDSPTLIETYRDSEWHHAVDIHAKGEITEGAASTIDQAAGYGWVEDLAEPALKIKYPGVGEVEIMRLSESGKRKGIAIMRWFNKDDFVSLAKKQGKTEAETSDMLNQLGANDKEKFIAPEPKRMKDITDYYVILRTFKGEEIANAWAKTYGYDYDKLLAAGIKEPPQLVAWKMSPEAKGTVKGSPSITVITPEGIKVSPSLARIIDKPVTPSGNISISRNPKSPTVTINEASPSLNINTERSSYNAGKNISPSQSTAISEVSNSIKSPSAKTSSPAKTGSTSTSRPAGSVSIPAAMSPPEIKSPGSPKAQSPGSKPVSSSPGSPETSNPKSPPSEPFNPAYPYEGHSPGGTKGHQDNDKKQIPKIFPPGTVAWKQGIGWWVFTPPYQKPSDRLFVLTKPQGAEITSDAKTAAGTIQSYGGKPPSALAFDMGIMDVNVTKPPHKPSVNAGKQSIRFKRDKDGTYGSKKPKTAKSRKAGPYYTTGGMVSRRPIG